jgi:hypothetical protein
MVLNALLFAKYVEPDVMADQVPLPPLFVLGVLQTYQLLPG